jgi:hypothetical protein
VGAVEIGSYAFVLPTGHEVVLDNTPDSSTVTLRGGRGDSTFQLLSQRIVDSDEVVFRLGERLLGAPMAPTRYRPVTRRSPDCGSCGVKRVVTSPSSAHGLKGLGRNRPGGPVPAPQPY